MSAQAKAFTRRLLPITLSQAAGLLCGVAGIKISSHLIPPETYGAYGIFLTFTPLGIWVTHAGLIKFVLRHWAASPDRAGLLREVRRAALKKLPLLAVLAFAAAWFVPGMSGRSISGHVWLFVWLFAGAALMSASQIAETALQAAREHWRDFVASATGSLTRTFAPLLAFAALEGAMNALPFGFAVHTVVFALVAWLLMGSGRHGHVFGSGKTQRFVAPKAPDSSAQGRACETLGNGDIKSGAPKGRDKWMNDADMMLRPFRALFSKPIFPRSRRLDLGLTNSTPLACKQLTAIYDGPLFVMLAVSAWILMSVNRWIVAGFFGGEAAGFFTLAGNVAVIVTGILGGIFMQYWQPVFFAMPADSAEERRVLARRVDAVALGYAVCGLAGVAALHVIFPRLIGILISANYTGSLAMIAPAGCFGVAMITGQFFHAMLLAVHKERSCATADLSGAAVLVAGGILAAALGGEAWFLRWLLVTPLVPWVVNRTLARRAI